MHQPNGKPFSKIPSIRKKQLSIAYRTCVHCKTEFPTVKACDKHEAKCNIRICETCKQEVAKLAFNRHVRICGKKK